MAVKGFGGELKGTRRLHYLSNDVRAFDIVGFHDLESIFKRPVTNMPCTQSRGIDKPLGGVDYTVIATIFDGMMHHSYYCNLELEMTS